MSHLVFHTGFYFWVSAANPTINFNFKSGNIYLVYNNNLHTFMDKLDAIWRLFYKINLCVAKQVKHKNKYFCKIVSPEFGLVCKGRLPPTAFYESKFVSIDQLTTHVYPIFYPNITLGIILFFKWPQHFKIGSKYKEICGYFLILYFKRINIIWLPVLWSQETKSSTKQPSISFF